MVHYKRSSTALLAATFVLLACAAIIGLDIWRTWQAHQIDERDAGISVTNMARALAQHADDTLKEADTVLVGLLERLRIDGTGPAALERLHRLLAVQVKELPQLNGIFVYDSQGRWIVNSQPKLDNTQNNADREYFIYHRDHPGDGPHIGPPVRSRSTGKWIATVTRRVNNADGSFGGVVLATVDMAYFQRFYDSFNIGKSGAILLGLNSGTIVFRRPLREDSIGKSMADAAIFRDHASKNASGLAIIKSSQDGVVRINGYRHLETFPLFVSVALSHDEVFAEWRADAYMHMVGVLLLVTGFAVMGRRMVAQIDHRSIAENEANEARAQVEKLNQILERLALQDGLTRLANRRQFDVALAREMGRAVRSGRSLALIMIDVDRFKLYNDLYGHLAGDECLRKVGKSILSGERRADDLAARYGGEEFTIILPDCDAAGALAIAEQIRLAVRAQQIEHTANPDGIVTVSLGIGCLTKVKRETSVRDLISMADQALYRAKDEGRDRVGM
ncbi:diguanylate cyclase [Herbaspirillum hiltneri N3]|uniref:diguanylate cyclase n=1 Tax=Herbaspirillum hiltneri N3 TaxID=1262470 RepID=A0ABM5UX22_9BURK|nr:sensor domain-containing diguanylate cyclase [Herbaspirillum hiltneri]AKZ61723.1 diguanylate cyclase [Herbaspirillum hiltneri N3]